MELATSSILLLLTALSLIVTIPTLFKLNGGKRLPPGPLGLPLLGRLPFLTPDLHHCFTDLARTYGPILSFRLGTKLCVVITSPSAATDVLKVHDAIFANRPPPVVATIATDNVDIAWAPNGPHWQMLRKVAVRELLSSSAINSFTSLRRKELRRVVDKLRSSMGEAVNIHNLIYTASLNVIMSMTWGGELGVGLKEEAQEVLEWIVDLMGVPNISDFLPMLALLDLQGLQRRMRGWCNRYDAIFDHIRKSREIADDRDKDFFRSLLDMVAKRDPSMPLQLNHVKCLLFDMLTGATDTTSTTKEWAMSELLRNPKLMSKAKEELDAVVGSNRVLEESDLPKLHYLEAVMKETLRLHPVLPLLIPHCPTTSCKVGGYDIPEGTRVFVNVWAIHRDPTLWEEPLEFKPERFLGQSVRWDYNAKSFDYFPFGAGRRMCPGINMGERMVMYLLGSLLHAFEWRVPEEGGKAIDVEEKFGLVLKKKEPLVLVPSIRMEQYLHLH